jgi:hypothetical protein
MSEEPAVPFIERRHCSDDICDKARSKWVEDTLWPKLRIQMAIMIGSTVVFCAAIFLFLSDAAITKYDLASRDRYVTLVQHQNDMARIEAKLSAVENKVTEFASEIRKGLDRNLTAIENASRR